MGGCNLDNMERKLYLNPDTDNLSNLSSKVKLR